MTYRKISRHYSRDKGRCTVVMNKSAYTEKCKNMLQDSNTCRKLQRDPTNKYKKDLTNFIRELRENSEIDFIIYKVMKYRNILI